jgi:hypothetical protein
MMEILERNIVAKDGDDGNCEDAIIITEDFVCVIDGTTSKSLKLWEGKKSGRLAAMIIGEAIKTLQRDLGAYESITYISAVLAAFYKQKDLYEEFRAHPVERFSASISLYSKHHKEIWMVGDCQAMIDDRLFTNNSLVDSILIHTRVLHLAIQLAQGIPVESLLKHDTGRDFIWPLLKAQSVFQNMHLESPYAYGRIDGFEVPRNEVKVIPIPCCAKQIVLATDGYPFIKPSLIESERALATILNEDPLCINLYKSTKGLYRGHVSFDDRAYVRFRI